MQRRSVAAWQSQLSLGNAPEDGLESQFVSCVRQNRKVTAPLGRLSRFNLPQVALVAGALFQAVWNVQSGAPADAAIKDYDGSRPSRLPGRRRYGYCDTFPMPKRFSRRYACGQSPIPEAGNLGPLAEAGAFSLIRPSSALADRLEKLTVPLQEKTRYPQRPSCDSQC